MYFFSKEADDIDRKPEKMKIYKAGYNAEKGYKDRHNRFWPQYAELEYLLFLSIHSRRSIR